MSVQTIEHEFREKVCDGIQLIEEGISRFRVATPFLSEDGDHLVVTLKRENGYWLLSDEGHTYMHLSYDMDEGDLRRGTRQTIITNALTAFGVQDREGELILPVPQEQYGDALYSFVQALLKINDVSYLARERVRSTFIEDFHAFMEEHVAPERRVFDWHDPRNDPDGKYLVDCRVNGMARPLYVYALPGDDRVRDATIAILQFERLKQEFRAVGVFENQEEVNRKVLARFSDVCEKQFSSLTSNRDRVALYLKEAMAG